MGDKVRQRGIRFFLAILFSSVSISAVAQYTTPNHEPATADDCQIIAQVLNAKTSNPLSFASFGAACDWTKLGLNVRTTTETEGWRAFFRKPGYDAVQEKATVVYSDSYNGTKGMYGSHEFRCVLKKQQARWQIVACVPGVIAN
jgi:hypothetical protein